MKKGTVIKNGTMTLTVLEHDSKTEITLLIRHSDGMYITCYAIEQTNKGDCSWYFGHYILSLKEAVKDYFERTT